MVKLLEILFFSLVLLILPAESPSTINSSVPSIEDIWQSANLPGKPDNSNVPFLLTLSLAFLARSLAKAACKNLI